MTGRDRIVAAILLAALALAAEASVEPSLFLWCGATVFVYASALGFSRPGGALALTPLSAVLFAYAGWLIATNLSVHPYTAVASYDAAFLVGGFVIGWRTGREGMALLLAVALAFTAALAVWSLGQLASGDASRGHAVFDTPSTLASTLNLVLAAGLVLVVAGHRNRWLLAGVAILAAGVLGTQSRGGWLALMGSALLALILLHRARVRVDRLWIALTAIALLAAVALGSLSWSTAARSGTDRLDLYRAALDALPGSSWLAGSGYLTFRYVLNAARPSIPGYRGAITDFVHDDYLQALLESGLPGALLLLLLAILPAVLAWRRLREAPGADRVVIVALAAAMASIAIHALVDFPFHLPLCLVLYGACAGLLSALLAVERSAAPAGRLRQVVRASVVAGAALILLKPIAAEAAAQYARLQWEQGRADRAAYWFELARHIEPRDWHYHAYAGEFWFVQAQDGAHASAARLADRIFEEGLAVNPREVSNLLWRISTHIYLRTMLPQPADAATLRAWVDRASALAPLDQRVQFHRQLVMRFEARATPR